MNESILKALMQLFAIVANVNDAGVTAGARDIVKSFLKQHLNKSQISEYLNLFDEYIISLHLENENNHSDAQSKRLSANSVRILRICQQINKELNQKEKFIVLVRLLEFIHEDGVITYEEFQFVQTVSEIFSVSETEFMNLRYLILEDNDAEYDKNDFLLVDNSDEHDEQGGLWFHINRPASIEEQKHLTCDDLDGKIQFLYLSSVQIFFFKYTGKDSLCLNSHTIYPNKIYVFEHGSIIKSSKTNPLYYSDVTGQFLQSQTKTKILFEAYNVEYTFKNSDNGIKNFNFSEESGQMIAIMGGSGVGKSTLLNLLNGKQLPDSGKILINGYNLHSNKKKLEGVIGFVPQDDLLIEELTVFQNLYFNAKLCFGNFNESQIRKSVENILTDLDLSDARNLRVGNPLQRLISGGQRKRLNIALELIREPSILLVDEPTSGLSSRDSEMVMLLLKQQTLKGKLVICNIHQPSSDIYKLFDKVWILDKGGYPIYNGNPIDAVVYFKTMSNQLNAQESECRLCGNVNAEQILQIVENKIIDETGRYTRQRKIAPKEWNELYLENIESKLVRKTPEEKIPNNLFKIPNIERQFFIFGMRNLLSKLSNIQYILITFLEAPILAFILSYFTKYVEGNEYVFSDNKNIPAYLFMSIIVALFLGLTISAEEIIRDRKILERESFLNLSRYSYLTSKIMYLLGVSAIQTISYVLVGNSILGIQEMTFSYWLILFTASGFANITGLNISSGLNSVIAIYVLIPFILVPQILLSGAVVRFDDLHRSLTDKINVPLVGNLTASRWAFEALVVTQFKDNLYEKHLFEVESEISKYNYKINYLFPSIQSKIDDCKIKCGIQKYTNDVNTNLASIQNELEKIGEENTKYPFEYLSKINPKSFTPEIAEEATDYLRYIQQYYTQKINDANSKKNQIIKKLTKTHGDEGLFALKQNNYNKALSDMVLNRTELNAIYQTPTGMLIRKKEPIYMYPDSKIGEAHFYAPAKQIYGEVIDTLVFNVSVIWVMSFILFITLYYDVLRKIIHYFETIKLRRRSRKFHHE